ARTTGLCHRFDQRRRAKKWKLQFTDRPLRGERSLLSGRPRARAGHALHPARSRADARADRGRGTQGVLRRRDRRFDRRRRAARRRHHHQGRSPPLHARLAPADPVDLPGLLADHDAAVVVGRDHDERDVEHSRNLRAASAAGQHRILAPRSRGAPAVVHVPLDQLTDKAYARTLAEQIDPHHASKTPVFKAKAEEMNTTHYSVMDAAGNAVATTTTLNGGFGSGVWIRGGGFFMNNEMDDFAAQPGTPNMFGLVQGEANAVEPGKRMLSAMSPTIVLDPQGKVLLVTGAAGGPTIITTTMQVILNVIEFHMSLSDAMHAPRLHHQALPDELDFEPNGLTVAVQDSLKAMGHALGTRQLATANSIMRVPGGLQGVGEPRSGGVAVGY